MFHGGGRSAEDSEATSCCSCPEAWNNSCPSHVGGKKPKCPVWDLKGQLCDLHAELKC